jgi:TetR/AcrR family transcriptional repressor of nem operon
MGTKGEQTRTQILTVAEQLILQHGYSGTSIDRIIGESGITKGGFFYHFEGKSDLARQLLRRYLEQDRVFFEALLHRAYSLTEDPLQQLLVFLKLMAEAMADLPSSHPGCLVASFTYESHQFDDEIRRLNAAGMLSWRRIFLELLQKIAETHPMKIEQRLEDVADMLTAVTEGGIVMSRCIADKHILPNQLLQFRSYIRLLFGDV